MGVHSSKKVQQQEMTHREKGREWQRQIRAEGRRLERDANKIRQEEAKLKQEIKNEAKRGASPASIQSLVRQVVRQQKAVKRIEQTQKSLHALSIHMTAAMAAASTGVALKMSAGIMKEMNALTNVSETQHIMEDMRRSMMQADLMEEMLDEGFAESDDEVEIDSEVTKVYEELALDASHLMNTAGISAELTVAAPVKGGSLTRQVGALQGRQGGA